MIDFLESSPETSREEYAIIECKFKTKFKTRKINEENLISLWLCVRDS